MDDIWTQTGKRSYRREDGLRIWFDGIYWCFKTADDAWGSVEHDRWRGTSPTAEQAMEWVDFYVPWTMPKMTFLLRTA
jgi:hypothetical protein